MNRRIVAMALVAVATLGMTGCTAGNNPEPSSSAASGTSTGPDGAGDAGQSVHDACALIADTITDATAGFEEATSDPSTVVDAMTSAAEKLSSAAGKVTNDQVAALVPDLQQMYTKTADVMKSIVAGDVSKVGQLTELGDSLQKTGTRFQELCGS